MRQQSATRDALVLCYHAISPGWDAALSVTPAAFERQIAHLLSRGWQPTTFHDAVTGETPGKVLAITFDDAFASVWHYARPILLRQGAPATVFVPTAYIDAAASLDWPEVAHWKLSGRGDELRAMTWEDLRGLSASGWEIGSHTCTHPWLTQLGEDALRRELSVSRARCSEEVGVPCRTIAYPFGAVDQRVIREAAAAGYTAGARLSRGLQNVGAQSFPRVGIYNGDTWSRFRLKVGRPLRQVRASPLWPEVRPGAPAG